MKSYISIDREVRSDVHVYAFDKLDGSNIRAEWSAKRGFYKFGTRNQMIDETHPQFGNAAKLIMEKYNEHIGMVFKEQRWKGGVCFFEYHGPNSFAGSHYDDVMDVTLFDVNVDNQGLLEPKEFIKKFGHLDIPKVLHEGRVNATLIELVKTSQLEGMTFEGVVCKGALDKKTKLPIMFKIKSEAWLTKLKTFCKGDEALYQKLF